MSRVVIVGAGIGGCIAALAAKDADPSADVHVLAVSPERYRHEPGTIDVLGYVPDQQGPVARPAARIDSLPADHPYNLVGEDDLTRALAYLDDVFADSDRSTYRGTDRNALAPTVTGGVRPTYRYPVTVAAGLVSSQRPMHLVGLDCLTHIDADLVADRLDSVAPFDVTASTVEFPIDATETPPFEAFARALDENNETSDGRPVREALARAVRPALDIESRVGFPPVLGVTQHDEIRRELESQLQAAVFELPVGEPNLPGIRLRERLFDRLDEAGIELTRATVTEVSSTGGSIQSVNVATETEQRSIEGDNFVLATGGVASGGLVGTETEVVEPAFDCPVESPEKHSEWSISAPLGDHWFARAGVDVTSELKPTSRNGPVFENLVAVGGVIGGHNFVEERSRSGVAVVTGYEAGRSAVDW